MHHCLMLFFVVGRTIYIIDFVIMSLNKLFVLAVNRFKDHA